MKPNKCHRCGIKLDLVPYTYIVPATSTWKAYCGECAYRHKCALCHESFEDVADWQEHITKAHRRVN